MRAILGEIMRQAGSRNGLRVIQHLIGGRYTVLAKIFCGIAALSISTMPSWETVSKVTVAPEGTVTTALAALSGR